MTVSTLRPNTVIGTTGVVTGGANALSDNSDASYVTLDTGESFNVGLDNLTLPAGAVIKSVAARLRTAKITNTVFLAPRTGIPNVTLSNVSVTWTAPTTVSTGTVSQTGITDSQIDSAYIDVENFSGNTGRVHEAYLDVVYVVQPVVTVTGPTTPVTDTNLPTVAWTNVLDADGGAQTYRQVAVYNDAQYTAPGFDVIAELDNAIAFTEADAPIAPSGATDWKVPVILPNDTYRAYVRTAQTVNGVRHWSQGGSDWDFIEFTVNVALPGTPTINATADSANARNTVVVTDVPSVTTTTDRIELERSVDGGTTWEPMRTLDGGFVDVPVLVATSTFNNVAATTHNVPLPVPPDGDGIQADDLLIAFMGMDGNPTIGWPSDWTEIKDEAGNGNAVRAACAWKRCIGGESGVIAATTSLSVGGAARILCIRNAHPSTAPEVSVGVSSAAANANPDALNPADWGTELTLWIAAMVNDGNVAVTAGPANYSNFGNSRFADAAGAGVSTATRLAFVASEDPGAFTNAAEDSRAFTVGVRPRNPNLTVYDYEAANGVLTTYRVRSLHNYSGVFAASAWVQDSDTWSSDSWWLKHPNRPDLNMAVVVRSFAEITRAGRQGVFQALGAQHAIVVSDTPGPLEGNITFRFLSLADQAAFDALYTTTATMLLQAPPDVGAPGYIRLLGQRRQRIVDWQDATRVFDELGFTVVESPPGDVLAWPA